MKYIPDPQDTAARTVAALRELAAAQALASNLASGLRADALLLDELFSNVRAGVGCATSDALAAAIKATDRALGTAQAIEGWSTLSRRWTGLLTPATGSPEALAMLGALATLNLIEDFLAHTNRLFAIAGEASAECEDVARALRQTLKKPQ